MGLELSELLADAEGRKEDSSIMKSFSENTNPGNYSAAPVRKHLKSSSENTNTAKFCGCPDPRNIGNGGVVPHLNHFPIPFLLYSPSKEKSDAFHLLLLHKEDGLQQRCSLLGLLREDSGKSRLITSKLEALHVSRIVLMGGWNQGLRDVEAGALEAAPNF
ncbi:conserved hypothetical protein [Ricinus communis]|uniref:Uncharacterized protein n=1 Tax=Ricinus communis TaxID=3988 RepID=B9S1F1_RICCO|nr:conserved hypothetical protein [Ricinus communis]